MTEPDVCPFCKETPNVAVYSRDPKTMMPGKPTYQVKCVSKLCANRTVETYRAATREDAVRMWNGDRA